MSAAAPPPDARSVLAAVADAAAVIERLAADLSLAEEPARFMAQLERETAGE